MVSSDENYKVRVAEAKVDLDAAIREVERVVRELSADTPRAEKTMVTDVLRVAFEKLASARARLALILEDKT